MKERLIHWISKSQDKKIGKVLASYSPKSTCPDSCTLKEGGCYAWGLFYLRKLKRYFWWFKKKNIIRSIKRCFIDALNLLHRVAGDCVGDQKGTLEECKILDSLGIINIGYTHDWRSEESQILKGYFRASCQNEDEVLEDKKKRLGYYIDCSRKYS